MAKQTIYLDSKLNPDNEIQKLVKHKKTFKVLRTNRTCTIEINDIKYIYTETILKPKYFGLMAEIKKEFLANQDELKIEKKLSPLDIQYVDFSESLKNMVDSQGLYFETENVVCMDITKAYYYTAFNLKLISKEFFTKCMKLPKHIRLMLVGSVATSKRIFDYENGKLLDVQIKEDEFLRQAWFKICDVVAQCMADIKNCIGTDFLFYWVDGIFFKPNGGENLRISSILMEHYKYKFTLEYCNKIEIINNGSGNEMKVYKGNTIKNFTVPSYNTKAYYLE
jgi:hypothetical protein